MKIRKRDFALLILDDLEEVRSALRRYFELYFTKVMVAKDSQEAEYWLREAAPDFLLCDYWLGEDSPPGTQLIPGWRKRFPSLKRVALMTGTKASAIGRTDCVDQVFDKPLDLDRVLSFFCNEARAS